MFNCAPKLKSRHDIDYARRGDLDAYGDSVDQYRGV